jgi:hypothetical protein
LTWAERLKRGFDIDISVCPLCGSTLRVIADVTDPDVIQTILAHLKQRAPPVGAPRRTQFNGPPNEKAVFMPMPPVGVNMCAASAWKRTSL